ncbi:MAG TPA: fused MFS/spermidine synthase [Candidatus Saccharimonas sp.]|nr:fused MFS/spermidine synthase [Candidatus Saccharimonas sp.]
MARLQKITNYEATAFVAGFALMAFEMVASRILAPTIGTSMYVWTSVIGVMIAALAAGYAVGGWLADKRVAPQDIAWLSLTAALAMTVTLLMYPPLLASLSYAVTDQRLQGVIAALVLFLPASFLMGMLSPYLARLQVKSLTTTGRSVARLSALNSVGGILGTFCVGFILFSWIGARETLMVLIVMLLGISWANVPRHRARLRFWATVAALVIVILQFAAAARAAAPVQIDTASAHYNIVDGLLHNRPARFLQTDPHGYQSGIYLDNSGDLAFDYTQKMAQIVAAAPQKAHMLLIGGGVFTLPEYLGRQYPASHIDVVEIDPQLQTIAKQYFNYVPPANVTNYATDARAFLAKAAAAQYDIILVDAFDGDSATPFSLATSQYAAQLAHVAKPGAVVAANIIGAPSGACAPLVASITASYRSAFNQSRLLQVGNRRPNDTQNSIGVFANSELGWTQNLGPQLSSVTAQPLQLTDNFAPVEALWQNCKSAA